MAEPIYLLDKKKEATFKTDVQDSHEYKFTNKKRRQLQHEFKIHLEKYFKNLLGKGSDYNKVVIWDDMLIIRGERFLTEPEKYIATTPKGNNLIKSSRLQITKQFEIDNIPYFEEKLGAKCVHQTVDIEPSKDYWIIALVFDEVLIETIK